MQVTFEHKILPLYPQCEDKNSKQILNPNFLQQYRLEMLKQSTMYCRIDQMSKYIENNGSQASSLFPSTEKRKNSIDPVVLNQNWWYQNELTVFSIEKQEGKEGRKDIRKERRE